MGLIYNHPIGILEAALRPNITPVPVKSTEQQDIQSIHRIRDGYISRRTGVMNQARGLLSEYGIIASLGHKSFRSVVSMVTQPSCKDLSPLFKAELSQLLDEYYWLTDRIDDINQRLSNIAHQNALCRILLSLPGIGVINATALYSAIGNGSQFNNGRELAVWLGLTPKQYSSGEKSNTGGITKRGNRYLRKQLVHGARALLSRCKKRTDRLSRWVNQLVARRGVNKACVALAARLARLAWVLLDKKENYVTQA